MWVLKRFCSFDKVPCGCLKVVRVVSVVPVVVSVCFTGEVADGNVRTAFLTDKQGNVAVLRFVVSDDGERHIAVLDSGSDFHAIFSFVVRISYLQKRGYWKRKAGVFQTLQISFVKEFWWQTIAGTPARESCR